MRNTNTFFCLLLLTILTLQCRRSDEGDSLITDTDQLRQELVGGWNLISAVGESEQWYFTAAGGGRYAYFNDDSFENGEWRIQGQDILLDQSAPRAVQIDGSILKMGNVRLQRDTSIKRALEDRLATWVAGTWVSDDSMLVYTFMENGYYQKIYTDDPTIPIDGDWYMSGMKIVEDDYDMRADPVTFYQDGAEMRWGAMNFYRKGARPEQLTTDDVDAAGDRLNAHTFMADLGRFGDVQVAPYQYRDRYRYQLRINLLRDGRLVYEMPEFPGNRLGELDGVQAISARDVDQDGDNDLLVIADYLQDTGNELKSATVKAYYRNLGRSFRIDQDMTEAMSRSSNVRSIKDMVDFIRERQPVAERPTEQTTSKGESSSSSSSSSASSRYRKYRDDRSVCRIRVAALQGEINYEKLGKLGDLGILSYEPADNGFTYVYLGKYISKYTAYRILDRVKRRGHRSAYVIVEQDYLNDNSEDDAAFSTYQFLSLKKLDMEPFNALDPSYQSDIYVTYANGYYRLSMGLYQKQLYPYIEEEFKNIAARLGYGGGFSRTIE
ncbi:MAG TPA: hypothetical protein VJ953_04285 [Saprospiraceae bacterium]|nr:hypothetical protein [Saprospiraceae bacterium]